MLRFLIVYIVLLAAFIFVLLFGECTAFEGTVVARAHDFLQNGIPDALSRSVLTLCGKNRGQRLLDTCTDVCVNRPNPTLQVVYVSLVTAGYVVFLTSAWELIPGPVLGPVATVCSLTVFLLTCFSDPGTITAANVDRHLAAFPYDDFLYTPKRCPTMRVPCPPRSKFSRITNRRVARFDHFCAWMNNDIGENNYRYFLGFLLAHVFLCAYGAWLMFAVIAGDVVRHGVLDAHIEVNGREMPLSQAPGALLQWVVFTYLEVAMLGLFLTLTCVLVTSFLGYHLWLAAQNVTTNEAWKRKDIVRHLLESAQYDAMQQHPPQQHGEPSATPAPDGVQSAAVVKPRQPWWRRLMKCKRPRRTMREPSHHEAQPVPPALPDDVVAAVMAKSRNIYDRGVIANLLEVLFPMSQRRSTRMKVHED